jgi:hypothetical protein
VAQAEAVLQMLIKLENEKKAVKEEIEKSSADLASTLKKISLDDEGSSAILVSANVCLFARVTLPPFARKKQWSVSKILCNRQAS